MAEPEIPEEVIEPISDEELEGWRGIASQPSHPICVDSARVLRPIIARLDVAESREASLLAERDALREALGELAEHHRQCELAGTRLAELVKRETGVTEGEPVDDNQLIEAAQAWDDHQWPALSEHQEER